jgi:hypothetical protein
MHLRSFEYFRAVAIVLIVVGHSYGIAGWWIDSFGERVLANLVSGGTSLFVFISGFLFHHVFYPKFVYRKFLEKKIRNVYIPYLILSALPIVLALILKEPFPEFYFGPGDSFYDRILRPIFLYYWYGGVMVYWYIPFIMAMFIISPVFISFIKISTRYKIFILIALSLISIFMHRPVNNWSIVQSVVYFAPVYMFGILCSMERDYIYEKFKGNDVHLLACVIFLAVVQAAFFDACGNLQKNPFEFNWIDISYIQKQILCVYFMVFLHKYEHIDSPLLKTLAASSFAIYFLHGWIIYLISTVQSFYKPFYGLHLLPVLSPLVIWASYTLAKKIRKAFPEKSRMIIGW